VERLLERGMFCLWLNDDPGQALDALEECLDGYLDGKL
jgi:hypothetical protein